MKNIEKITKESSDTVLKKTNVLEIKNSTLEALKAEEGKKLAARKAHYWKKGQTGNPAGRPKGARGKLTLLREAVLHNAEEMVLGSWEEVVQTTIALANNGDTTALKILWDRVIPSKRAIDVNHNNNEKMSITINVGKLEVEDPFTVIEKDTTVIENDIVDAEVIEE